MNTTGSRNSSAPSPAPSAHPRRPAPERHLTDYASGGSDLGLKWAGGCGTSGQHGFGALRLAVDRRVGEVMRRRRTWKRLSIKQKSHAKNDVALIEPHLRIAEIGIRGLQKDAFRAVTTSRAEKHLKRALWIAENSPQENWEVKKDCLLVLADFYTLFGMRGRATRYYSVAWELMSSDENYRAARARDFGTPVPLARVAPYPYARFEYRRNRDNIDPDEYLEGEMIAAFTINKHGRTENPRIIDADPADFSLMERRVLNSVEDFIYRPRHIDGKAAATLDQQYRVTYYYLPADRQASIKKSSRRGGH